tara:strand:+ start:353 stop:1459 length:1107 start_codon:yes stop_codon:yes gene_type:complete
MKNLIGKKYNNLSNLALNRNGSERSRTVVQSYQCSPNPENYAFTPFEIDLRGMNARQRAGNITRTAESGQYVYHSNFTIGMEVEKSRISREVLSGSQLQHFCQLMKGIERDGSCGLEAITNVLPLLPQSLWRNKMFNLMYEAETLIDEAYSQSDEMNSRGSYLCGGHITIASRNHSASELNRLMRPYYAILYALNRKRLANQYCCENITARTNDESRDDRIGAGHTKYQPIFEKPGGKLLEFRLWSRFTSVKQMINRYKLMHLLVDFAVNDRGTYAKFIKKARPILLAMYNNNAAKVDDLIQLSRAFVKMLCTNKINEKVASFIYVRHLHREYLDRLSSGDRTYLKKITTRTAYRQLINGQIRFASRR